MPVETVYGQQVHDDSPPGSVVAKPQVPVVQVLWNTEAGFVQVVSKVLDAEGGRYLGDDYSESAHYTDGMYVDLDRVQINALIRYLRRARNMAFGADE